MRNKKGIILSVVAGIFLIVILLGLIQPFNDENETKNQEATVTNNKDIEDEKAIKAEQDEKTNNDKQGDVEVGLEIDDNETNRNEISSFIAHFHQILNEITTYNRHEFIDWDNMNRVKTDMSNRISELLEQKDSLPFSMQIDLERMQLLADIGTESHDSTAIIYIHRIFHDLDVEYNNYKPNNKFGFSNYDSGGENQMVISNYIKENGLSEDTH